MKKLLFILLLSPLLSWGQCAPSYNCLGSGNLIGSTGSGTTLGRLTAITVGSGLTLSGNTLSASGGGSISGTAGAILYGTGTATAALFNSAGTSGQVLTSAGTGAPTWTTPTLVSQPNHQIVYGTGSGISSNANFIAFPSYGIGITDSKSNIFIGAGSAAGNSTTKSSMGNNIGLGGQSLEGLTSGINNIAIGSDAEKVDTSGKNNIAIGVVADESNLSGSNNVAIGGLSLNLNIDSNNIAVGYRTMFDNTIGHDNVGIGHEALYHNVTGSSDIAIGIGADINSPYSFSNSIEIGSGLFINKSNEMIFGNATDSTLYFATGALKQGGYSSNLYYNKGTGQVTVTSDTSSGGGGSLPPNQVGYGTGSGITSTSNFIFNPTASQLYINIATNDSLFQLSGTSPNYTMQVGDIDGIENSTLFAVTDNGFTSSVFGAIPSHTVYINSSFTGAYLNINGVPYLFTRTQGTANTVFTNDGSGNITSDYREPDQWLQPADAGTVNLIVGYNAIDFTNIVSGVIFNLPTSPVDGQICEIKIPIGWNPTTTVALISFQGGTVGDSQILAIDNYAKIVYNGTKSTWY